MSTARAAAQEQADGDGKQHARGECRGHAEEMLQLADIAAGVLVRRARRPHEGGACGVVDERRQVRRARYRIAPSTPDRRPRPTANAPSATTVRP